MDSLTAVLSREFPNRDVASVSPALLGNHKDTTVVDFVDGESVVVQLSRDPEALRLETALARAVNERTTIPVPRVLATGAIAGRGYAVVERATGAELHERFVSLDAEGKRAIAATFGRGLAELHAAFSFDGYGALTAHPVGTRFEFRASETSDWRRWFRTYVSEGIDALPSAFDSLREHLVDAVEDASLPERPESTLYPWDLRPGNALVGDDGISAVLDWGDPLAASPGLAVAKVEHLVADWYLSDESRLRRAFRDGYGSVRPYPSVEPIYRVAAVVRSAVDSNGEVTRPGYPERTGPRAVSFHRDRLDALL